MAIHRKTRGLGEQVQERSRPERAADGVPSGVSQARLAHEVKREVAELRVRMSEASLRSGALRDAGHPHAAAEVVAEQRAMLDDFRNRLDAVVSAAAVEREAELVLAAELARADGHAEPRRLPAALSAALAAAALLALSLGPTDGMASAPAASAGLDAAAASDAGRVDSDGSGSKDAEDRAERSRQPEEQASFSATERAAVPPPSSSPGDASPSVGEHLIRLVEVELARAADLAQDVTAVAAAAVDTVEDQILTTADEDADPVGGGDDATSDGGGAEPDATEDETSEGETTEGAAPASDAEDDGARDDPPLDAAGEDSEGSGVGDPSADDPHLAPTLAEPDID